MPKPKLMIKKSSVEIALRKRTCMFSDAEITKDAACLVLFEDARDRYVYCKDVALKMIEMARERLTKIEAALNNGTTLE